MLVPPREHDVIIPWDIHFPSRAEALGFLEAIKWTQPGALYDERYWTLGEAIRWIAERTPDAVDQAIASAEACEEATKELQEALEAGEISSTACLPNDSVPRQVPPETWGTHMVCLRTEGGVLTPCVMHDSAETQTLVCVRLRRDEVLKKWPSVSEETRQLNTAAKETACRRWLTNIMRESPEAPRPKKQVRAEAQEQFPGLSQNAFNRAWANAIADSGAEAWGKAGRRP